MVHTNDSDQAKTVKLDLSRFATIGAGATVTPVVTTESPAGSPTANALVSGTAVAIDAGTRSATLTVPAKSVTTFIVNGASGVAADAPAVQDGQSYSFVGVQSGRAVTASNGSRQRSLAIPSPHPRRCGPPPASQTKTAPPVTALSSGSLMAALWPPMPTEPSCAPSLTRKPARTARPSGSSTPRTEHRSASSTPHANRSWMLPTSPQLPAPGSVCGPRTAAPTRRSPCALRVKAPATRASGPARNGGTTTATLSRPTAARLSLPRTPKAGPSTTCTGKTAPTATTPRQACTPTAPTISTTGRMKE